MDQISEMDRQKIIIDSAIYSEFNRSSLSKVDLAKIIMRGSVESYCPVCKKKSVFTINSPSYSFDEEANKNIPAAGVYTVTAKCMQNSTETYNVFCGQEINVCFRITSDTIIKIGQFPSRAVIDFGSLDKAFKELDNGKRKELGTAIGLFSHGVGIGSFVYLRRIFEGLINEAHILAKQEQSWDEEKYNKGRMNDKITQLKQYLPTRLVKTANLYGILSKGVHELSEEECLQKFDLVKQAIQFILSEKVEDKEYEKIAKEFN